jgi:serine phosphatase RsbU (regulator of sigma subunit)
MRMRPDSPLRRRLPWLAAATLVVLHFIPGVPLPPLILADILGGMVILRRGARRFFYRISRKLIFSYVLVGVVPLLAALIVALVAIQIGGSLFIQHQFHSILQNLRLEWDDRLLRSDRAPDAERLEAWRREYPSLKVWGRVGQERFVFGAAPDAPAPSRDGWIDGRYHMVVEIPGRATVALAYEDLVRTPAFRASGIEAVIREGAVQTGPAAAPEEKPEGPTFSLGNQPDRDPRGNITYSGQPPEFPPAAGNLWTKPLLYGFYAFPALEQDRSAVAFLRASPQAIYRTMVAAQPSYGRVALYLFMAALAIVLLLGGIAVGYATWLIFGTTRGINRLSDGVRRFAEGDLDFRIHHRGRDELAQLMTSFNRMAESLQTYIGDEVFRAEQKRELELAYRIQNLLLPSVSAFAGLGKVSIHFKPSKEAGGDYYDYFRQDGLDYILIGDASGHGLAASITMAMTKAAISALLYKAVSPSQVLTQAHAVLQQAGMADQYVTLQLVCVDRKKRTLRLFNAGHPPAYLRTGGALKPLRLDSFPIGIFDGPAPVSVEHAYRPNDLLFLYTDGLYEVHAGDDMYGLERLEQLFLRVSPDPDLALEEILADVEAFKKGEPYGDDLTLIVVKLSA